MLYTRVSPLYDYQGTGNAIHTGWFLLGYIFPLTGEVLTSLATCTVASTVSLRPITTRLTRSVAKAIDGHGDA